MAAEKTRSKKPVVKNRNGGAVVPGNPGNTGGKPGRSGRKSNDFIAECAELANDLVLAKIRAHLAIAGPEDPAWRWCADYVSGYGKGKPTQPVSGESGGPVVVRVVREAPGSVSD